MIFICMYSCVCAWYTFALGITLALRTTSVVFVPNLLIVLPPVAFTLDCGLSVQANVFAHPLLEGFNVSL